MNVAKKTAKELLNEIEEYGFCDEMVREDIENFLIELAR